MNLRKTVTRLFTSVQHLWRQRLRLSHITLRWRLMLYAGCLSFGLNLLLASFINAYASAVFPQNAFAFVQPLGATGTGSTTSALVDQPVVTGIEQTLLSQLQVISIGGLAFATVLTGVGAYWLAGRTLSSLHTVSRAAQQISANTLDTRLAWQGPEDEIKELADAFDVMLERLQGAFNQQTQFVADAAHELRTPLATLRTNLEVVTVDQSATLADYRGASVVMERTLTRIEELVAGLLILATGEQSLFLEEVSLEPLLEEVLCSLRKVAREQQITLHLDCPQDLTMMGDGLLLARVFSNLVENGIQYNKPGGAVTVTVRREDGWLCVMISDTGWGIADTDQAHIFDRFYRTDKSRTRRHGGAGLGLAIAAHIIQQHGGKIEVESTPGNGSCFTIRLPLLSESDKPFS